MAWVSETELLAFIREELGLGFEVRPMMGDSKPPKFGYEIHGPRGNIGYVRRREDGLYPLHDVEAWRDEVARRTAQANKFKRG